MEHLGAPVKQQVVQLEDRGLIAWEGDVNLSISFEWDLDGHLRGPIRGLSV
jgi:hypothetical protein